MMQPIDYYGYYFGGMFISLVFYGGVLAQASYYLSHYSRDSMVLKGFVLFLIAAETLKEIAIGQGLWTSLVHDHGNVLDALSWNIDDYMMMVTTISIPWMVQAFYIFAIWKLLNGRKYRVPVIAAAIAFMTVSLGCSIVEVYEIWIQSSGLQESVNKVDIPSRIQSATELGVNVLITTTLCCTLHGFKGTFNESKNIVSRLIIYVVNRGAILLIFQVIVIALYNRQSNLYSVFYLPLSTIDLNNMLITLNGRQKLIHSSGASSYSDILSDFHACARTSSLDDEASQNHSIIPI